MLYSDQGSRHTTRRFLALLVVFGLLAGLGWMA
ncbi:hypothetical protein HNQ63_002851 [Wenzhouxiangella marina]|uniref:Uncharacterized protein n=1 Tax=Wenzhouxiangella marina TaxID=1579979 RepID=A0A0K0XSK3_9GAMM|nr:hypothetical protein WM2015_213 [Wenzhouxiangella marina]MBB6088370.1 hypothetical protein [Wenzhouxiangella marina]